MGRRLRRRYVRGLGRSKEEDREEEGKSWTEIEFLQIFVAMSCVRLLSDLPVPCFFLLFLCVAYAVFCGLSGGHSQHCGEPPVARTKQQAPARDHTAQHSACSTKAEE